MLSKNHIEQLEQSAISVAVVAARGAGRPLKDWILQEWRRTSKPQWRQILAVAKAEGDLARAEYATWILADVLGVENGD